MQKPPLVNSENHQSAESADDLSLFRGGLFYRLQVLTRLVDATHWNLHRRVVLVLATTWLPLAIITAVSNRDQLVGLLTDYQVYSRIVIAIPVLLIGQFVMENRFRVVATHVRQARLLGAEDLRKLNEAFATIRRLRDSPLSELVIVALVFADLTMIWHNKIASGPAWSVYRDGGAAYPTLAGWYYVVVCIPIYQLLIGLSFWKWSLWSFFLLRLARMDLKVVATHPDAHGGLGFLGLSPSGFAPVAFALSSAIGGTWRNEILSHGAQLANFKLPAIMLSGVIFLIALGPLAPFVPRLDVLRRTAMLEYGVLAQRHAIDFHERWVVRRQDPKEQHFSVSDVSALADFAISYRNIKQMRPFPADKGTLIGLALAIAVPLFPAVLAEFPLSVILQGLLQAVKAAPM